MSSGSVGVNDLVLIVERFDLFPIKSSFAYGEERALPNFHWLYMPVFPSDYDLDDLRVAYQAIGSRVARALESSLTPAAACCNR